MQKIAELRDLTGLGNCNPSEVFEIFKDCASGSRLTKDLFFGCFRVILSRDAFKAALESSVLDRLFELFDTDGNGVVDLVPCF